jgi:hypothetical protein
MGLSTSSSFPAWKLVSFLDATSVGMRVDMRASTPYGYL